VLIHPYAGVLSAYGMGLADQTALREQAVEVPLTADALPDLNARADTLAEEARAALVEQGADPERVQVARLLHCRYRGTDAALIVPLLGHDEIVENFTAAHRARFGFANLGRAMVVENVAVEATAPGEALVDVTLDTRHGEDLVPLETVSVWSGGAAHQAPVFDRAALRAGDRIAGPALVREDNATTVIEPGWTAEITARDHMLLHRTAKREGAGDVDAGRPDPVLLELFNNLFMNVAEQTGAVLQNTSMSVNIKERLDFSCAIFDGEGRLVANAPHIPVHLGAMGESVRTVLRLRGATLKPGDVVALNNPYDGGTHLPDVTVITPVFDGGGIRFFVASRGHHADIGGITPGSTPPHSATLEEEGVLIDNFLLVDGGEFQEQAFRDLLAAARYPARSPDVNVADISAQVAANEKGVQELQRVVAQYGWDVVSAYMRHVMDNACESVRRVIDRLAEGVPERRFSYRMDNGAALEVRIAFDRAQRSAVIDFAGTGPQSAGNFNAPPAVTRAAVLYVFRCLVGEDIPLNDGCMTPLDIRIPAGTFLSPAPGAAVVAGNTEVSQAVTNALFGALGAVACAQATMNNLLFGDATQQYYETICGGTGAGADFDGTSAVQSHMTNTRMTDPEVLELRHPVRVERFAVRAGSGGVGKHRGGDGAVRRLRFLAPMHAVVVASRRRYAPFGLAGGAPGAVGRQWIERAGGGIELLGGTAGADMAAGDVLVVETPGGGGFGTA
jgi:5-oxoprolinase (ATP-hydrolysing)